MTTTTHSPRTQTPRTRARRRLALTVAGEVALLGAIALVAVLVRADLSTVQREVVAVAAVAAAVLGVVDLRAARALR